MYTHRFMLAICALLTICVGQITWMENNSPNDNYTTIDIMSDAQDDVCLGMTFTLSIAVGDSGEEIDYANLRQYVQYLSEHDFFSATCQINNVEPEEVLQRAHGLLNSTLIDEECMERVKTYYGNNRKRGNDEINYYRSYRPALLDNDSGLVNDASKAKRAVEITFKVNSATNNYASACDCAYIINNMINPNTVVYQWRYKHGTCIFLSPQQNTYLTTGYDRLTAANLIYHHATRDFTGYCSGKQTSGWVTKSSYNLARSCMSEYDYCQNV